MDDSAAICIRKNSTNKLNDDFVSSVISRYSGRLRYASSPKLKLKSLPTLICISIDRANWDLRATAAANRTRIDSIPKFPITLCALLILLKFPPCIRTAFGAIFAVLFHHNDSITDINVFFSHVSSSSVEICPIATANCNFLSEISDFCTLHMPTRKKKKSNLHFHS